MYFSYRIVAVSNKEYKITDFTYCIVLYCSCTQQRNPLCCMEELAMNGTAEVMTTVTLLEIAAQILHLFQILLRLSQVEQC